MMHFSTPESAARAMAFVPRSTDVFITTFPKAGTTLVQQIVHGLRTGGDLDFEDISEVVPWFELAGALGQDLDSPQRAEPRAFKTHLDRSRLPRGGREIWVVRDPEATLVSMYAFFSGWFLDPACFDLETFALDYFALREGPGNYWTHLLSGWSARNDEKVLYLCYEDVVQTLAETVARIARFIGIEEDAAGLEIATRQADVAFMKRFPGLWDDALLRRHRNPAMGLPIEAKSTKVRAPGEKKISTDDLSGRVRTAWRAQWAERIAPNTGLPDYAALRAHVRNDS